MSVAAKIARAARRRWRARLSLDQLQGRLGRRRGVLTLSWHSLAPEALQGYNWCTAPGAFAAQMEFLAATFDIVGLDTAMAALRDGTAAKGPRPLAVVTFDDAYRDLLDHATPVLERHAAPATLFVPRDLVRAGGATHMTEAELRALAGHPLWSVGAHGLSHNVLTAFRPADQEAELDGSRDWLAGLLGEPPTAFAYPQGALAPDLVERVRARYAVGMATDRRAGDRFDPCQVRRHCPVAAEDDLATFARALLDAPMEDGRN